mgnify:CR=1 FL=1|tara:strand:- start:408 stop:560 length:153 start_codon:yes stop_codon:yes gene_type:complete
MTWTYEIEQQTRQGNLIPLWTVSYYDTNNPNTKHHIVISTEVKEVAYPDD